MNFSSVFHDIGRRLGEVSYVVSPILLVGGIAEKMGAPVPILLYTEAVALSNGLIAGGIEGEFNMPDLDNLWCHWQVVSCPTGSVSPNTIFDFDIAVHKLGNQNYACGHVIENPITVSMQMLCPARGPGAMVTKLATLQSLQAILNKHTQQGGRFTVMTPGFYYSDMMLQSFVDITPDHAKLPASLFRLDFKQIILPKTASGKQASKNLTHIFTSPVAGLRSGSSLYQQILTV